MLIAILCYASCGKDSAWETTSGNAAGIVRLHGIDMRQCAAKMAPQFGMLGGLLTGTWAWPSWPPGPDAAMRPSS